MVIFGWRARDGDCPVHGQPCLFRWEPVLEQVEIWDLPPEVVQELQDEVREGREASEDGELSFWRF